MSSQKRKRDDLHEGEMFQMVEPSQRQGFRTDPDTGKTYWTHKLYRGRNAERVRVTYCRNLEECEAAMKLILYSLVLGFDLEWKQYDGPNIKDMVSVIQLASESHIIIIHIAAFPGGRQANRQQLISPALKAILEDPSIIKAGLRISSDGDRLRGQLGIYMQGVLEVAELRPTQPPLKNPSLSKLTETFLDDMPLDKKLSTSTWHHDRRLDPSQIEYAAVDAYAGLKLYQRFAAGKDFSTFQFVDFKARESQKVERDPASLYEKLIKLRLQLTGDPKARILDVGANKVLVEIASQRPKTRAALKQIPGMKSSSIQKYGDAILEVVRKHIEAFSLEDSLKDSTLSPNASQDPISVDGATINGEELLGMIKTRPSQAKADTTTTGYEPARARKRAKKNNDSAQLSISSSSFTSSQHSPFSSRVSLTSIQSSSQTLDFSSQSTIRSFPDSNSETCASTTEEIYDEL